MAKYYTIKHDYEYLQKAYIEQNKHAKVLLKSYEEQLIERDRNE